MTVTARVGFFSVELSALQVKIALVSRSASGVASVTVVAASLTEADIDATAAYAQGRTPRRWLRFPARPQRPGRLGRRVDDHRRRRRERVSGRG